MLKTVFISAAALALVSATESKPAASEQAPAPATPAVAAEEKPMEDPTKELKGHKLREWIEDEFDDQTDPAVLNSLVAVCPHLNRSEIEKVPHFIFHINSECFAALMVHEEKSVMKMLLKITTKEQADELVERVGEPLLKISEEKLGGHPSALLAAIKEAKKAAEATEKSTEKEEPQGNSAVSCSASAGLIAVIGVVAMLC